MAEGFALDRAYLDRKREQIRRDIAYARYRVGDAWYKTPIVSAKLLESGEIETAFIIDHTVSGSMTVTEVELREKSGALIGGKPVRITRADATEGIMYVIRLRLFQAVESEGGSGAFDDMQEGASGS